MADDELLAAIRRKRVLRLTREAGLLAPTPRVRKRSRPPHDGAITVSVPDTLWATDATEAHTGLRMCRVARGVVEAETQGYVRCAQVHGGQSQYATRSRVMA